MRAAAVVVVDSSRAASWGSRALSRAACWWMRGRFIRFDNNGIRVCLLRLARGALAPGWMLAGSPGEQRALARSQTLVSSRRVSRLLLLPLPAPPSYCSAGQYIELAVWLVGARAPLTLACGANVDVACAATVVVYVGPAGAAGWMSLREFVCSRAGERAARRERKRKRK